MEVIVMANGYKKMFHVAKVDKIAKETNQIFKMKRLFLCCKNS